MSDKKLTEANLQDYIAEKLGELGWRVEEWGRGVKGERKSLNEIVLENRLFEAIERINGLELNDKEKKEILSKLLLLPNSIEGIKVFLEEYLKYGVPLTLERGKREIAKQIFLIDFENPENNDFLAVREFEIEERDVRKRFDFCLFINGIPLVIIETKNPFAEEEEEERTWYAAYKDLIDYEKAVPGIFKFVQFCIATDGYTAKYFPNYYAESYETELSTWETTYPLEIKTSKLFESLDKAIYGMLTKQNLVDLVENFIFIKKFKDRYIKIIARWMQFKAANKIFERVTKEKDKKLGLIWHWQGSGKSLTMAFAAWKLFRHVKLEQPTIFIVVDRRDLQKQLVEKEFLPIGIEFVETVKNTRQLVNILKWGGKDRKGKRGIFVCLIQKFSPKKLKKLHDEGEINLDRENIVIFTDESHRSQYGTLATTMRGIFKNAFIFGFTGTPLTKPERNTFAKFSPEGEIYLDRFGMLDSIKDGFTLPIRYEARLPEVHIKPEEIEELGRYEEEVLEELSDEERKIWKRKIRPKVAFLKSEERIEKVCRDIAEYFKNRVEKTGFKAMIAVVDRECCVLFKRKLDELLGEKYCEIVMTYLAKEKSTVLKEYREEISRRFKHSEFDKINEKIISQFKDEEFPKILIVSDMLLTGFDAKNLWTLFLYKPLKEHRLLQAIARTNRPYPNKEFGLVVDYIGIAEYLEEALEMFETDFLKEAKLFIRKLEESEKEFEELINELKAIFSGMEIKDLKDVNNAVEFLILNDKEEEFLSKMRRLRRLYELISPSEVTFRYADVYSILTSVEIALRRYRRRELRLEEIERMARKTYELIQKTIGIDKIEKVGEIEVNKELEKLEKERRPIAAIRVISEVSRKVYGKKGDFYVSIRKEIEKIYRELKTKKIVTKEIIERIKQVNERLTKREAERKRYGEVYPIFEVLKSNLDENLALNTSKEIFEELKIKGLLKKDNFLKESRRRRIRRVIREKIIDRLGYVENLDEIENKIFVNLEGEYG